MTNFHFLCRSKVKSIKTTTHPRVSTWIKVFLHQNTFTQFSPALASEGSAIHVFLVKVLIKDKPVPQTLKQSLRRYGPLVCRRLTASKLSGSKQEHTDVALSIWKHGMVKMGLWHGRSNVVPIGFETHPHSLTSSSQLGHNQTRSPLNSILSFGFHFAPCYTERWTLSKPVPVFASYM